jgi:single-minded-like protein
MQVELTGNSIYEYIHNFDQDEMAAVLSLQQNMYGHQVHPLPAQLQQQQQAHNMQMPSNLSPTQLDSVTPPLVPPVLSNNTSNIPSVSNPIMNNQANNHAFSQHQSQHLHNAHHHQSLNQNHHHPHHHLHQRHQETQTIEIERTFFLRMKCVLAKRNAGLTTSGYKVN